MTRTEIIQIEHELSTIFEEAVDKMNKVAFPADLSTQKNEYIDGLDTHCIEFHIEVDIGKLT